MNNLEFYADYLKAQTVASYFNTQDIHEPTSICMIRYFDDNFGRAFTKRFVANYVFKLNSSYILNMELFLKQFNHTFETTYVSISKLFVKDMHNLKVVSQNKDSNIEFISIERGSIYRLGIKHADFAVLTDDFYEEISDINLDKFIWGYCHGSSSE